MRLFAIADLHLSFSGHKPMDVFGPWWTDHARAVEEHWRAKVSEGDAVCLPGDFSWSMRPEEAAPELAWLAGLPGKKILIRGNHDYWWGSLSKVRALLPGGVYALQNDSLALDDVAFAGARGWIDPRLDFSSLSGHSRPAEGEEPPSSAKSPAEDRQIFERELTRLDASLSKLDPGARVRVALLHFPPTSPALEDTEVTALLEKHRVDAAVFGHLHRSGPTSFKNPFGVKNGVTYYLASADFIDFDPVEVV